MLMEVHKIDNSKLIHFFYTQLSLSLFVLSKKKQIVLSFTIYIITHNNKSFVNTLILLKMNHRDTIILQSTIFLSDLYAC